MSRTTPSDSDQAARPRPGRTWRSVARFVGGVVLALLGLLWMLQGADVIRIDPIGCVAECEPITGGSPGWFAAGAAALVAGLFLLRKHRRRT